MKKLIKKSLKSLSEKILNISDTAKKWIFGTIGLLSLIGFAINFSNNILFNIFILLLALITVGIICIFTNNGAKKKFFFMSSFLACLFLFSASFCSGLTSEFIIIYIIYGIINLCLWEIEDAAEDFFYFVATKDIERECNETNNGAKIFYIAVTIVYILISAICSIIYLGIDNDIETRKEQKILFDKAQYFEIIKTNEIIHNGNTYQMLWYGEKRDDFVSIVKSFTKESLQVGGGDSIKFLSRKDNALNATSVYEIKLIEK